MIRELKRLKIEAEKAKEVCKTKIYNSKKDEAHVIVIQRFEHGKYYKRGFIIVRRYGDKSIVVDNLNTDDRCDKNEFIMCKGVISKACEYLNKLYKENPKQ